MKIKKKIFNAIFITNLIFSILISIIFFRILFLQSEHIIETEMKNELDYISITLNNNYDETLKNLLNNKNRITIMNEDGNIKFDNEINKSNSHNFQKEIINIFKDKSIKSIKKLKKNTIYVFKKLKNNSILIISNNKNLIYNFSLHYFLSFIPILIFIIALMILIALKKSKNIITPINNIDLNNFKNIEIYDELSPLITELIEQEKKFKKEMRYHSQMEKIFDMVTDNLKDALIIIDSKKHILFCNNPTLKLFNIKHSIKNQNILNLNRSQKFNNIIDKALKGNYVSKKIQINDSLFSIIANPFYNDNIINGVIILLIDITEKEQREKLRREFTANVSHELKTPLTSISGYAELLSLNMVKTEDIPNFNKKIYDESQKLINLVNDIIKISQLDEDSMPNNKVTINLMDLTKQIIENLKIKANDLNISISLSGEDINITTFPKILYDIIFNLIDNAIKYNKPNGKIDIKIYKENEKTLIEIADTGIGINSEDQKHIFERFYRSNKHGSLIEGTGLGLSIVKHGINFLGASLELKSKKDKGSTFKIIFDDKN